MTEPSLALLFWNLIHVKNMAAKATDKVIDLEK